MAKAPSFPAIVIANDLLDGDVLFLGPEKWEANHRHAAIARNAEEAEHLLERAGRDIKSNRVVDAYLAVVTLGADGAPEPIHYREKMRTKGPTIRPDLGKQAGL